MRILGRAVAVSLAMHAGLGAAVVVRSRGELGIEPIEIEPIEPEPVQVALIDIPRSRSVPVPVPVPETTGANPNPAAVPAAGAGADPAAGADPGAGAGADSGAGADPGAGAGAGASTGTKSLGMRYRPAIGLPDFGVPEPPTAPAAIDPLAPLERPRRRPELQPSGRGFKTDLGATTARTDAGGRVAFDDDANLELDPSTLGGSFDITDALMRTFTDDDPYSAKKLAFLDRTRDERAQIAARRRAADLDESVRALRAHLARIWARSELEPEARRRILFELWDECADSGSADTLAAAEAARATVIGFVRRNLPRGSPDAYSVSELARLNAGRSSKRRFAP